MIYPLKGTFQHYDWGGKNFIPQLLKINNDENKLWAEYWLGSHITSPSLINNEPLNEFLNKRNDKLEILFKVLDVQKPLSIQLHPNKLNAEIGFKLENKKGIPLHAFNRTYKDDNHKPEMMVALSDFYLLHGFKKHFLIKESLKPYESFQELIYLLDTRNFADVYQIIMTASQDKLSKWILPVIEKTKIDYQNQKLTLTSPEYWLHFTMEAMNLKVETLDAGLICFYLMNIVSLKKGEAIYQGSGIPHAYLRGQNIELMAASDNVIRGGLTTKYIDIDALLKNVNYQEINPQIISELNQQQENQWIYYPTPDYFSLRRLYLTDTQNYKVNNNAILFVYWGELIVNELRLIQGNSLFINKGTEINLSGNADIFLAE